MRLDIQSENLCTYFAKIQEQLDTHPLEWVRYVNLGVKVVRIINYAKDFTPHVERQLTYTLQDTAEHYDATIIIWHEKNVASITDIFSSHLSPHRLRLERLMAKRKHFNVEVLDEAYSKHNLVVRVNIDQGLVEAYDQTSKTYYYGVRDLASEEFIKQGHIFVQMFNKIVQTDTSHFVHGALVGLDNKGVLFCARGQRGKSTLSVLSMMEGFEYVSDDYLILEKVDNVLYSHPIYSIITLSPRMYSELYDKLEGSRFVSNNARKDKYVVNITNYHHNFRKKYPISLCMFPEIVNDAEPSIIPCPKGRSITQLVHSTVNQLQDINNTRAIEKLIKMVNDFEFYQINLCQDIFKNTTCLRHFLEHYEERAKASFVEDSMYVDVTFDLATFLDSENYILYSMNKFATNIYENLVDGVDINLILEQVRAIPLRPDGIEEQILRFVDVLTEIGIIRERNITDCAPTIKSKCVIESKYKLSLLKYTEDKTLDLMI